MWRNIFHEARTFQKNDSNSQNFQSVMEWLLDMVDLSDFAYQNRVTWNLTIKYGNAAVGIEALTEHLKYIFEWQREKQEWNHRNLMNLCLTEKVGKTENGNNTRLRGKSKSKNQCQEKTKAIWNQQWDWTYATIGGNATRKSTKTNVQLADSKCKIWTWNPTTSESTRGTNGLYEQHNDEERSDVRSVCTYCARVERKNIIQMGSSNHLWHSDNRVDTTQYQAC